MYATPFTAALIEEKFKEKIDVSSYLKIVPLNSKIKLGKFEIDFVTLTHSILEPNGLSITTPLGTFPYRRLESRSQSRLEEILMKKLKEIGKKGAFL